MKKCNLFILGSFLLALMSTTPYASCVKFEEMQEPIKISENQKITADQAEKTLKDIALPENKIFSFLRQKYYTSTRYLSERIPSVTRTFEAFVICTVAGLIASRNINTATLIGATAGSITYGLSQYFAESLDMLYYRLAYERYSKTLKSIKDLLKKKDLTGLNSYIWLHFNKTCAWPLVNTLILCESAKESYKEVLKNLKTSKNYKPTIPNNDLTTKRKVLKKLVLDSLNALEQITILISKHEHFKTQYEMYKKAQENPDGKNIFYDNKKSSKKKPTREMPYRYNRFFGNFSRKDSDDD